MAIPPDVVKILTSTPRQENSWMDEYFQIPYAPNPTTTTTQVGVIPKRRSASIPMLPLLKPNIVISVIDRADRRYLVEQARHHNIRFVTADEYLTNEIVPQRKSPLPGPSNEVFFCHDDTDRSVLQNDILVANALLVPVLIYVSGSEPPVIRPTMGGVIVATSTSVFRDRWKEHGRVIKDSTNTDELFRHLFSFHVGPIL